MRRPALGSAGDQIFRFMSATGIETSIPTVKGGGKRVDTLQKSGFRRNWKTDFHRVADMGLRVLRYGPLVHTSRIGAGGHDRYFSEQTFTDLKRREVVPIADLRRFGLPDLVGDVQNPQFPAPFDAHRPKPS